MNGHTTGRRCTRLKPPAAIAAYLRVRHLTVTVPHLTAPDLQSLLGLFYGAPEEFGQCTLVASANLPEVERRLLAHEEHMTEVMEAHHGSPVDVEVLTARLDGSHYARKIILRRQSDRAIVQYGIVRLNFECVPPDVQREIESRTKPLGRVLIEHDVLRKVMPVAMWRIEPSTELKHLFGLPDAGGDFVYGRTALIYTNHKPAVELLEVVAPK